MNENSIEPPNFVKNDTLLYLSEDKIVKGFKFQRDPKQHVDDSNSMDVVGSEAFMVSHCHFPGATDTINLATLLSIGNKDNMHLIGENCLTYYQIV